MQILMFNSYTGLTAVQIYTGLAANHLLRPKKNNAEFPLTKSHLLDVARQRENDDFI